jgi:hypothetical protein
MKAWRNAGHAALMGQDPYRSTCDRSTLTCANRRNIGSAHKGAALHRSLLHIGSSRMGMSIWYFLFSILYFPFYVNSFDFFFTFSKLNIFIIKTHFKIIIFKTLKKLNLNRTWNLNKFKSKQKLSLRYTQNLNNFQIKFLLINWEIWTNTKFE